MLHLLLLVDRSYEYPEFCLVLICRNFSCWGGTDGREGGREGLIDDYSFIHSNRFFGP